MTPQIVTEVSNHASKLPDGVRERFMVFFGHCIGNRLTERAVTSKEAVTEKEFPRIGVTDAAILSAGREAMVLSIDLGLVVAVRNRGGAAVNFNHVREAILLRDG